MDDAASGCGERPSPSPLTRLLPAIGERLLAGRVWCARLVRRLGEGREPDVTRADIRRGEGQQALALANDGVPVGRGHRPEHLDRQRRRRG